MLIESTLRIIGAFLACAFCVTAWAANEKQFDVPSGDLTTAVEAIVKQSGAEIVYQPAQLKGLRTNGVTGTLTVQDAVTKLLADTSLSVQTDETGAMVIATRSTTVGDAPGAPSDNSGNARRQFDIAAKDMGRALNDFRAQSGIEVAAAKELISGKKSKAVRGMLPSTEALRGLLKGSGLTFAQDGDGKYTIRSLALIGAAADADGPVSADVSVQGDRAKKLAFTDGNMDIARTIDDVQPYYVFSSEDIEQSDALNLEDFLKQRLTMNTEYVSNSQIYGSNAGPNGNTPLGTTSSINLRGLGTNETLILVDGRRRAGISIQGNSEQPDINGIPLAAIDRIEVLPAGASAIYGAGAMGGVINIILKRSYEGGQIKYSYGNVVVGHGPISTADGSYGFSLEGGDTNVMLTGHYSDATPIVAGDRENIAQRGIDTILQNQPSALYSPFIPFQGGTTPNISSADYSTYPTPQDLVLKNGQSLNSPITYIPAGANSSTNLTRGLLANAGAYNLNPLPGIGEFGLQQPLGFSPRVESAMATVHRQMTPWLDAFAEFSVENNTGTSVYNPISDNHYNVPSTAPTNPFTSNVTVTIPSALSAPIDTHSNTTTATTGLTAKLPYSWSGELDYTWSQNRFSTFYDLIDIQGIMNDLASGALNPFVDTIAYPLNLSRYLQPNTYSSSSELNDLGMRLSGPMWTLPWGNPHLTVGLEHRLEGFPSSTQYANYPITTANDGYTEYFGQHQSTNAIYAEADVPIVTDKNSLWGIRGLELQVADRLEKYSVATGTASEQFLPSYYGPGIGAHFYSPSLDPNQQIPVPRATASYGSNNETLGLKYKPFDELSFRISRATAFLPPTYSQLLPNPTVNPNGDTIFDPKFGTTYSVNTITGGNPDLKPEHDKSWNAGFIYEPNKGPLAGLRVNLEYYRIAQFGFITGLNGSVILNSPGLADRVTRDPKTGLITLLNESLFNATEFQTNGWDLSFDYRIPTTIGTIGVHAVGTLIEHENRQYFPETPTADYVGWPSQGGEVKTKANATATWAYRQWIAAWTTTWFGSYGALGAPGSPTGLNTVVLQQQGADRIPSQLYHDIVASYTVSQPAVGTTNNTSPGTMRRMLSNLTVQIGVKNIFNSIPPFEAINEPFYYSYYGDLRLREYWISVRKNFGR